MSEAPSSPPARSSRRWARLGPIPQRSPANIRGAGAPRSIGWLSRRRAWTRAARSEEHTSELQSLMRISYDVFCLKKKNKQSTNTTTLTENSDNYKIDAQD